MGSGHARPSSWVRERERGRGPAQGGRRPGRLGLRGPEQAGRFLHSEGYGGLDAG